MFKLLKKNLLFVILLFLPIRPNLFASAGIIVEEENNLTLENKHDQTFIENIDLKEIARININKKRVSVITKSLEKSVKNLIGKALVSPYNIKNIRRFELLKRITKKFFDLIKDDLFIQECAFWAFGESTKDFEYTNIRFFDFEQVRTAINNMLSITITCIVNRRSNISKDQLRSLTLSDSQNSNSNSNNLNSANYLTSVLTKIKIYYDIQAHKENIDIKSLNLDLYSVVIEYALENRLQEFEHDFLNIDNIDLRKIFSEYINSSMCTSCENLIELMAVYFKDILNLNLHNKTFTNKLNRLRLANPNESVESVLSKLLTCYIQLCLNNQIKNNQIREINRFKDSNFETDNNIYNSCEPKRSLVYNLILELIPNTDKPVLLNALNLLNKSSFKALKVESISNIKALIENRLN